MANWLQRLKPKSAFARGVGVLVGGTAGAQLLTILVAPLLTRLYGPEDFALVAVYGSLLAMIGVISSLRYELAIPLPEDDGEAANVAALSLILVGVSTLLTGILVLQLGHPIADALSVPQMAGYLWLLPVGVLLGGGYSVFNYWSVRTKRFSTIAETKIRQSLASIAIQLAAFKLGGLGLLLAQVAGQSVGTTSLARPALASAGFKQMSWGGIWRAAGRYRRFPIFSTWESAANTASIQLPPIILSAFFGPLLVGLYALSHRVLMLPMSIFGGAVGQVFLSEAPDSYRKNRLSDLVYSLHSKLAHFALPPLLMLAITGPEIFTIVFGPDWGEAGEIAQWMAPWLYFQFVSSPISTVFAVREKLREALVFQASSSVFRLIGIYVGLELGDSMTAIAAFSLTSAASYFLLLFWTMRLSGNMGWNFLVPTFSAFIYSLICVSPLLWIYFVSGSYESVWQVATIITALLILFRYILLVAKDGDNSKVTV